MIVSNYQNVKYLFKFTYYYYYVIFISEIIINTNDNNDTYFEKRGLFNCCTCKLIYFQYNNFIYLFGISTFIHLIYPSER